MIGSPLLRILFILLLVCTLSAESGAQCCAAGNPVSADGSPGGTGKKLLEISLLYQHSYSSVYYSGDKRSDYTYISDSYFDFSSLRIAYGFTRRLKARAEIGYFFDKAQSFTFGYDRRANGCGDLVVGLQYHVYNSVPLAIDVFPSFDVTFPVGRFDQMNGPVVLPIDIQPSSGSFKYNAGLLLSKRFLAGKIALILSGNAEFSQRINTDRTNYKYGNLYQASLIGAYTFLRNFTVALQVRTMIRERASNAEKEKINATGGTYLFLSPQLRYTFFRYWSAGFIFDFPFYRYVYGTQLTNDYAFSFRFTRAIQFGKKKQEPLPLLSTSFSSGH